MKHSVYLKRLYFRDFVPNVNRVNLLKVKSSSKIQTSSVKANFSTREIVIERAKPIRFDEYEAKTMTKVVEKKSRVKASPVKMLNKTVDPVPIKKSFRFEDLLKKIDENKTKTQAIIETKKESEKSKY